MSERTPALELRQVSKWYGQVRALEGADLAVYPGEVHGLVGDNGAGKSTLVKIAAGAVQPDDGRVVIGGREVALSLPAHAGPLGRETVHQGLAVGGAGSGT